MAKYLVSGGAGFIGSHITDELIRRGGDVRIIDNLSTGKRENIASVLESVHFIDGDIRDLEACRLAVEGVHCVFHQAALSSVPLSIENPLLSDAINIRGTLNLLLASREAGVNKFVLASSASVYGGNPKLPIHETEESRPLSPYALTKRVGEEYCRIFSRFYGLPTVCLRYFNVFGPRQDPSSQYASVIPRFIEAVLEDRPPVIFGDGEQTRDFIYVSDVVQANLLAADAADANGEVLNIGSGKKITVNQLFHTLIHLLGKHLTPVYDRPRPGDVKHSYADISEAEKMIQYNPEVAFEIGVEKTIAWYRERR